MKTLFLKIKIVFIITVSGISFSHANMDRATEAYFMGDYAVAYSEFLTHANEGNSYAQIKVGFLFENGWGVEKSYSQAREWYLKAAETNDSEGYIALAKLYAYGKGIAKNQITAENYLIKAAELGNLHAYYILGDTYNDVFASGNDDKTALKWYLKAAENNAAAKTVNGHFSKGSGQWFRLNTPNGIEITEKEADNGNQYAQFNVALRYYYGEGTGKNHEKAGKYFLLAAEQGNVEAQNFVGQNIVFTNPNGFDKVAADMWFTIADKGGYAEGGINKKQLEATMTKDEIGKAETMALEWIKNHAKPNI